MISKKIDQDYYCLRDLLPETVLDAIYAEEVSDDDNLFAVATTMLATGYDDNDTYGVLVDFTYPIAVGYRQHYADADDRIMLTVQRADSGVDAAGMDAGERREDDLLFDLDSLEDFTGFSEAIRSGGCLVYAVSDSEYLVRRSSGGEA